MTTTSAANSGSPNGGSVTQLWTICPVCGQSYKYGEEHLCFDAFLPSSTADGAYWTCSVCGQRVPYGELHACGERAEVGPGAGVWDLADPPDYTGRWPYADSVTVPIPSLEERRVRALERIAAALERLTRGDV